MPHSIHVGFLSPNDFSIKIVQAISEQKIISEKNIYIVDPHGDYAAQFQGHSFNFDKQDTDALIRSEVAVLALRKRELSTVLAYIDTMTRGKIVLAMGEGIDCAYVMDRVAKGTLVVAAPPVQNENGEWETQVEFSPKFPPYMKAACIDIISSVCKVLP